MGKKLTSHSSPPGSTLALIVALKWGTVWTYNSIGTGIMKGQSSNFQIHLIKNMLSTSTLWNSCANWDRRSYSTSF